jgi:arylformamidase
VLQAVEDAFEGELGPFEDLAVAARHGVANRETGRDGDSSNRGERAEHGDVDQDAEAHEAAAGGNAGDGNGGALLQALGAGARDIGVEADGDVRGVHRDDGGRDFIGVEQVKRAAAWGEPAEGGPEVVAGFPGHAVGATAFDRHAFVAQHRLLELREHFIRCAGDGAAGGGHLGAGDLGGEAALLRDRDAGPFLGEGLADQARREADLGAGGDELVLAEQVRRFVAGNLVLELGGAGQDTLDRGAVKGAGGWQRGRERGGLRRVRLVGHPAGKVNWGSTLRGERRVVDLSHTIEHGMVTLQGFPAPVICDWLSREQSRERYEAGTEFQIGRIDMIANTGTYLDTPFHRYANGFDLADLELSAVSHVPAVVVRAVGQDSRAIDWSKFVPIDCRGMAVLVHTGWDRHWGTPRYFEAHPYLTAKAADYLRDRGARLVGIDSLNIDDMSTGARPVHSILLAAGIPIVEHLRGLDQLPSDGFEFSAVPPKVRGMGTFPVRAHAHLKG